MTSTAPAASPTRPDPSSDLVRQVLVTGFAGPESLQVVMGDRPDPGPGEVLVSVEASSATTSDSVVRRGLNPYTAHLEPPFVLGYDLVGVVAALGPGSNGFAVGDRVVSITRSGGNADAVVVPVAALTRLHSTVDAALVEPMVMTGATATAMVRRLGRVQAGDVVYVQGASGGVGLLAVQASLLLGATVIASASPGKHAALARLGAATLDYRDPDLVANVRRLAPGGAQFAFDAGGASASIAGAAETLADGGLLVSFGFTAAARRAPGRTPEVLAETGQVFAAAASAIAEVNLSPRGLRALQFDITGQREADPEAYAADLHWLLEHVEGGRLVPVVRALPLEEVQVAHRALDAGTITGRVVLDHRLPQPR